MTFSIFSALSIRNHSLSDRTLSLLSSRACPDSYFVAHTATTYVVLLKENHMRLMEPQLPTGNPGKPRNLQFSVCKAWRDCSLKMSKMLKVLKVLK